MTPGTLDSFDPSLAAQNIIRGFLKVDPNMSLHAAVALMRVYRKHTQKLPISTANLSPELMLSPSTTTRLMSYLGQGKEDEGFKGLDFVRLDIDKKDRRRRPIAQHHFSGT